MARKAKGKKKVDPERKERNRRLALAMLVSAVGIGAFVGTWMGVRALDQRASDHLMAISRAGGAVVPAGQTGASPVMIVDWPRDDAGRVWLPLTERERLSTILTNAARGGRPLSPEPLAHIGSALVDTGWFEGVPTVRWTPRGEISVTGSWRPPAAAVRIGPREHIIDYQARLLPLDYPSTQSNQIFLLHPSQPRPEPGSVWEGEEIRAALDLILLLQREGLLEQVAGIDLGDGRNAGRLEIVSDRGARLIWGGGPDHLRPGEQPTSVKVSRLRSILDRTGRIDGGVTTIDLRGQQILLERGP